MATTEKMAVLGGPTFRELRQLIDDINTSGNGSYDVVALLDDNEELHGTQVCGVTIKGPLLMAHEFPSGTVFALAINNDRRRIQRMEILRGLGLPSDRFPALVHPSAIIDPSTKIGYGSQLFQLCTTADGVVIGEFCMLSPFSLFALDCRLGNGVLAGARVTALGEVSLGSSSFIGSGSLLMKGIEVGPGAFVGAGSLVAQDVKSGYFTMGNPARQQMRNIQVPEWIFSSKIEGQT